MTVVVAVADGRDVVMGADCGAVCFDPSGSAINEIGRLTRAHKIFRNGAYLVGYCSSYRLGQAVMSCELPDPGPDLGNHLRGPWMDVVVAAVEAEVERLGEPQTPWPGTCLGGQLLVGVAGQLFLVQPDGTVFEHEALAIGAGRPYAYGALHATKTQPGADRVAAALSAALEFSPMVAGPTEVLALNQRRMRAA